MLHDAVKSSHQVWPVKKRPDAPSTRSWQKMREKKRANKSRMGSVLPWLAEKVVSNFVAGYSLIGLDQNLKTTRKGSIQIRSNP